LISGFYQPPVGLAQHFCACGEKALCNAAGDCGGSASSTFCLPPNFQPLPALVLGLPALVGTQRQSPLPTSTPCKGVLGILQQLSCGDMATAKPLHIKPSTKSSAFGVFQPLLQFIVQM